MSLSPSGLAAKIRQKLSDAFRDDYVESESVILMTETIAEAIIDYLVENNIVSTIVTGTAGGDPLVDGQGTGSMS